MTKKVREEGHVLDGTCGSTWLMSSRMTSDIIVCDELLMIKLYSAGMPRDAVEEEIRLTNLALYNGIRVPIVRELVNDGERWGYSYEKVHGPTFMDLIMEKGSDLDSLATTFAHLHRDINGCREPRLPPLKARLRAMIEGGTASEELKEEALTSLDALPDGDRVCHGDFHPGNVIAAEGGGTVLDWVDSASGHHIADVARSLILMRVWLPRELEEMGAEIAAHDLERFAGIYLERSLMTRSELAELDRWLFPVAVARLCQEVPGEEQDLMRIIKGTLDAMGLRPVLPR